MTDLILHSLALIGALTVCYHLEMLSRCVARRSALAQQAKGEGGGADG